MSFKDKMKKAIATGLIAGTLLGGAACTSEQDKINQKVIEYENIDPEYDTSIIDVSTAEALTKVGEVVKVMINNPKYYANNFNYCAESITITNLTITEYGNQALVTINYVANIVDKENEEKGTTQNTISYVVSSEEAKALAENLEDQSVEEICNVVYDATVDKLAEMEVSGKKNKADSVKGTAQENELQYLEVFNNLIEQYHNTGVIKDLRDAGYTITSTLMPEQADRMFLQPNKTYAGCVPGSDSEWYSIIFTTPTYSIHVNSASIRNVQFRVGIASLAVNEETGDQKFYAGSFQPYWEMNKTKEEFDADIQNYMGDNGLVEFIYNFRDQGTSRWVVLDDNVGATNEKYQFFADYADVFNSTPGMNYFNQYMENAIDLEDVEDQTYLTAITSMADANNPLIFVAEPTNENNLDK